MSQEYGSTRGVTRFTRLVRCPVCGGFDNMPRGEGRRCGGFISADGKYIHCQREELAGGLNRSPESGTYAHRAMGQCKCGVEHAPADERESSRILTTYDYRDARGALLFQTVRLEPKAFRQRRPNPDRQGEWHWNLQGVMPVLYKLPELRAAPEKAVWIVEGEKDVERLAQLGLLATCNAMGAGKWRPEYAAELADRHVLIIPDNDPVGRQHALNIANQVAIVAASVRMLELPGLSDHGDVSDWLAQPGHGRAELEQLAKSTPVWGKQRREAPPRRVVIPTLKELLAKHFEEPRMIVETLIPEGTTLLVGGPKVGKTMLMEHIALAVAQGGYVMGRIKVDCGRSVYLALEDSERLCQKRFLQLLHGRDCPENLHICSSWRRFDDGGLEDLDIFLSEHRDTRLVVVDTLARVRKHATANQGIYQQDYEALGPLTDLAHRHNCAIVIVHHTRKMQSDDLMDMVSGSAALAAAVDAVLVLQRERFGFEGIIGAMGRDLEEQKYAVTWDKDLHQLKIEGNADEFARSKEQNAVLALLKKAAKALHIQEIAEQLGRTANSALRMLLSRMVEAKLLISPARGEYKAAPDARAVDAECHFVTPTTPYAQAVAGDPAIAALFSPEDDDEGDEDEGEDRRGRCDKVTKCPACGYTVSKPAPYDPTEIICAHCFVLLDAPLHTHQRPPAEADF